MQADIFKKFNLYFNSCFARLSQNYFNWPVNQKGFIKTFPCKALYIKKKKIKQIASRRSGCCTGKVSPWSQGRRRGRLPQSSLVYIQMVRATSLSEGQPGYCSTFAGSYYWPWEPQSFTYRPDLLLITALKLALLKVSTPDARSYLSLSCQPVSMGVPANSPGSHWDVQ